MTQTKNKAKDDFGAWLQTLDPELSRVLADVAALAQKIRRGVPDRLEKIGHAANKFGEQQEALDVWMNQHMAQTLLTCPCIKAAHSEELEKPLNGNKNGRFTVTLDPLDGSSNALSNNAFGAIVGVYEDDLPVPGKKLKAALFLLFGPATTMNATIGKGVLEFVRHHDAHRFKLAHQNVYLPPKPRVLGLGGTLSDYPQKTLNAVMALARKEKLKLRYSGSLCADLSQILHYGGAYAYPATPAHPNGKLRLYFEANPLAFITEQACGKATDGKKRILDKKAGSVDERTPLVLGSADLVDALQDVL